MMKSAQTLPHIRKKKYQMGSKGLTSRYAQTVGDLGSTMQFIAETLRYPRVG